MEATKLYVRAGFDPYGRGGPGPRAPVPGAPVKTNPDGRRASAHEAPAAGGGGQLPPAARAASASDVRSRGERDAEYADAHVTLDLVEERIHDLGGAAAPGPRAMRPRTTTCSARSPRSARA